MKRHIIQAIFALICSAVLLSGCSSDPLPTEPKTDEAGNLIISSSNHRTVMLDTLPYDVKYNDSSLSFLDVEFYENKVNHSHHLFILATLDVSNLDEDQLHWLRESDLEVYGYITSESNDYNFKRTSYLGSLLYTDTKELVFVLTSNFLEENRNSFAGSNISLIIDVTQEEKTEDDWNKVESLHYSATVGESLPDPDTISDPLRGYIAEWLYNKADFYGSLS